MSKSIEVGRICKLCGEQIELQVETNGGYYTDDLAALLRASRDDTLLIEAHCGCSPPRTVALEGTTLSAAPD